MSAAHILIVDDDTLTTQVLRQHFEHQGYRVSTADGCEQAKTHLRRPFKIDLMILDYLMPDGSGTDLLQWMSREDPAQKPHVIMSSSWIDSSNPDWKTRLGRLPDLAQTLIQAYINKPFSFDNMDTVVQLVLGGTNAEGNPKEICSGDFKAPRRVAPRKTSK